MTSRTVSWLLCCTGFLAVLFSITRQTPAQEQAAPAGAAIFAGNCAACHGSDGRGGERAPNIATRQDVVSLPDSDLIHIVHNGISGTGMPGFGYLGDEKIKAVVAHLRTLQGIGATAKLPGNPAAGETLFFGKAECARCHVVNGRGGFMGADLSGYGHGRSPDAVRAAIVDPDAAADRSGQTATVVTKNGQRFSGLIRSQDNFFVVLQTEDGAFHNFAREQIAQVQNSGHSLMPGDYATKLSRPEIDDLISYLLKVGSGKAPVKKQDEDDD